MPFIPHTDNDIRTMLDAIGAPDIDALFDEIPANLRAPGLPGVPPVLNEMEIGRLMADFATRDGRPLNFIGAGAYEHHIPSAVWAIVTRGEFYSAYTPYQAEASQGTLQLLYEYQTMMASLTGLDISNASLYDGASGLAEACLMAVRANRKSKSQRILLPVALNPTYRDVTQVVAGNQNIAFEAAAVRPEGRADAGLGTRAIQGPGHHRRRAAAAEFLRHARGRRRRNRLGARQRRADDRRGQPDLARRAEAAGPVGQARCRHRRRRRAAARRAAVVGRSVLRLHGDAHGARAPDAGPHHRSHARPRRQARLHAHAAGARAAHPSQQGDVQHLHQPGPAGHGRDDLHVAARREGPRAGGGNVDAAHAAAGGCADARARRAARLRPSALPRGGAAARSSGHAGARGARASRHHRRRGHFCTVSVARATRCWCAPPRRARSPTSRPMRRRSPKAMRNYRGAA